MTNVSPTSMGRTRLRTGFLIGIARVASIGSIGIVGCLCAGTGAGCGKPQKEVVLGSIVLDIVVPQARVLRERSLALQAASHELAASPTPHTVLATRRAWRTTAVEWRRAFAFRLGPIIETNALLRAACWPVRPSLVQAVLADGKPIDGDRLEELGVQAKGLFVLELLLFPAGRPLGQDGDAQGIATAAALAGGVEGERRRQLIAILADRVAAHAEEVVGLLGESGGRFASRFVAGGQSSINVLVNQMVETIEGIKVSRLEAVSGLHKSGLLKPEDVEGWPSRTSQQLTLALLVGTEQLYLGAGGSGDKGVGALVRAVAPAVDARARDAFRNARSRVEELGAALEDVARSRPGSLDPAVSATQSLELVVKTEVANALGVTLTFTGGDGD